MKFTKASLSLFLVVVTILPIATLMAALRFIATRRAKRTPGLEDWFSLCAWAVLVVHDVAMLIAAGEDPGASVAEAIAHYPETFAVQLKLILVAFVLFIVQQFFAKLSVAALYLRIFGIHRGYRKAIYGLVALQSIWVIAASLLQIFACKPVHKFWYPVVKGTCKKEGLIIAVMESVNSFTDIAFVGLAMHMVRELKVFRATKVRLYILFGLGALAGVVGIAKIAVTYKGSSWYPTALSGLLSNVQMVVGIICCCVPVFKPLLPGPGFLSRLYPSLLILRLKTRSRSKLQDSPADSWP